jgi:hypothetical protein
MVKMLVNKESKTKNYIMIKILFCSYIFLILVSSCNSRKNQVEIPQDVQKRAHKLETEILYFYDKNPDSLKLKSARFLLKNGLFHTHYEGDRIKTYSDFISQMSTSPEIQEQRLRELENQYSNMRDSLVYDISQLSNKRLTDHVNSTIDFFRNTSWNNQIPFSVFCEYLLPYNVGKEAMSPWGTYFREAYFQENDSSVLKGDIETAITTIHQWIYNRTQGFNLKWGQNGLKIPDISPIDLDHLKVGSCQQLTIRSAAIMRALGIPATIDYVPFYLGYGVGHSWCTAIIDNNKFIPFDATTQKLYEYRNNFYKMPKVYRQVFSIQKDSHLFFRGPCSFLPETFNSPFLKDVTTRYAITSDLVIPIKKDISDNISCAYLALFTRSGWVPVDWGKVKQGSIYFNHIGRGGVYLIESIETEGIKYINTPFILSDSGEIRYLMSDNTHLRTLKLLRKYPLDERKAMFLQRMVGGIFQGANTSDFRNAVTLAKINSNPGEHFNTLTIKGKGKFRYVRYFSPHDSYGNIAEIEFYQQSESEAFLKGEILGTEGSMNNNPNTTRLAAFDKNILTYVDYNQRDSCWVGLDLGKEVNIAKIRFIARNDKNAIQKGNEYELFYWNNAWVSLGRKTDTSNELMYSNAPSNALFWLHNHTEGKEERIFTYENNEQVWW